MTNLKHFFHVNLHGMHICACLFLCAAALVSVHSHGGQRLTPSVFLDCAPHNIFNSGALVWTPRSLIQVGKSASLLWGSSLFASGGRDYR